MRLFKHDLGSIELLWILEAETYRLPKCQ